MSSDLDKGAVDAVADLARQGEKLVIVDVIDPRTGKPVPMARIGTSLVAVKDKLDPWMTQPERRKGTATTDTLESFIALVNRHKDADSALFAGENLGHDGPALLAVIDYNREVGSDGEPASIETAALNAARFGEHRILYPFPFSDELELWKENDGTFITQGDLAELIEANVVDLAAPDADEIKLAKLFGSTIASPAELMLLARDFRVKVEAVITESRTLQSGEAEIGYEETHKDGRQGAKGTFKVPGAFVISIPLFVGDEKTRVFARLRYRVQQGKVIWQYSLYKLDEVLRQRIADNANKAASQCKTPIFFGNPER